MDPYPKFVPAVFAPLDANQLVSLAPGDAQSLATAADEAAYATSDADFLARHQSILSGERAAEAQLLRQMQGDLDPAAGAQLVRSGLGAAFQMTGGAGGVIPGSVGNFAVAKGIGLNMLLLQRDARAALADINLRNQPRRIGIGGGAVISLILGRDATYNEVQFGNFQGQNQISISNAVGQYQRDVAAWRSTPQDEDFFHRILNGALTGASEGWKFGSKFGWVAGLYGAAGGFLGGAADGGMDGYAYQYHQASNALVLGSTGSNGITYNNTFSYG